MTKYCSKCNSGNPDDAKFCTQCGSRLTNMGYNEEEEQVYEDDYLFFMVNDKF